MKFYKYGILFLSTILLVSIVVSCEGDLDYDTLVQQGLNSGEEYNELFLDYELGMTREDFFEISWEMNQEQKITGLVKIDYELTDLKSRANKKFYPDFVDDRISKIPVDVHYLGWAPWNKELSSDSLVVDLVELYEKEFDTSFNKLYVPRIGKEAYVSVKGNREITVYPYTEIVARVEFIDLNQVNKD